mmetsp:Transcript_50668/g.113863  ORF Transcript_50668/g.113863 Transcript_50668/m.113863 type:complete len:308 (+) Transcript_50668:210-1133(+)
MAIVSSVCDHPAREPAPCRPLWRYWPTPHVPLADYLLLRPSLRCASALSRSAVSTSIPVTTCWSVLLMGRRSGSTRVQPKAASHSLNDARFIKTSFSATWQNCCQHSLASPISSTESVRDTALGAPPAGFPLLRSASFRFRCCAFLASVPSFLIFCDASSAPATVSLDSRSIFRKSPPFVRFRPAPSWMISPPEAWICSTWQSSFSVCATPTSWTVVAAISLRGSSSRLVTNSATLSAGCASQWAASNAGLSANSMAASSGSKYLARFLRCAAASSCPSNSVTGRGSSVWSSASSAQLVTRERENTS